jgi:DNA-binding transcriptional LysR family regulator
VVTAPSVRAASEDEINFILPTAAISEDDLTEVSALSSVSDSDYSYYISQWPLMFDLDLLRTFMGVVDSRNFTAAGQKLGLSQSTISQHIRKLEEGCGRQLLDRDTHGVALTVDGEVMAGYARQILDLSRQAVEHFADAAPRGRVRFGVSEDLTQTGLPQVLREFTASHPMISVELSIGLASMLYQKLDAGRLDLVFAKRRPSDDRGHTVWREKLIWIAHRHFELADDAPVPLVVYPSGSITSAMAMDALTKVNRSWYVGASSETLSGLQAAVSAGLGVTAQSPILLKNDELQAVIGGNLPEVGEVEFVVLGRSARLQGPAAALAEVILQKGGAIMALP